MTTFSAPAGGTETASPRRLADELAAFHEITVGLADRLDVDGVLETILERAASLVGTADAYLYLPEGDDLVVRFGLGQFVSHIGYRMERGNGVAGRVLETGEPLAVPDYQTWWGRSQRLEGQPFHAVVGVPLHSRDGGVAGVIGLAHSQPGPTFSPAEVDLVRRFAHLASLALENARLYASARQGEDRYRSLVANIPGAIYRAEYDTRWRIAYISEAIESISAYPAADFMEGRRTIESLIHPEERPAVMKAFERLVQAGEAYTLQYRITRGDGSVRWVSERTRAAKVEGRIVLEGSLFDETERMTAEEAVRAAEARYRSLVEHLPLVTYVRSLSLGHGNLYVSPQVEEMLGTPPEEWLVSDLLERVVHPDDRVRVLASAERLRATGESTSEEYRIVRPDGRIVWVLDETRVIVDDAGRPAYVQGFLVDITQRREAEETRSALAAVVDASYDAIYGTSVDGVITSWNPAASRIYGYEASEIVGRHVSVLTVDTTGEELTAIDERVLEQGQGLVLDTVRRRKDGTEFNASLTVAPVVNARGEVVGKASVLRDVTDRRRAEAERERLLTGEREARAAAERAQRELAEQNAQLRELDRLKDEFIALVSHELRTPLTSIRGYIDLILDDNTLTEQQRKFLEIADRNSDRLLRLVGDLLFLAQLEAGTLDLMIEPVDLGTVARESVAAARPSAEAKEIALEVVADEGVALEGDSARLAQVVDNLISNAIKFTPAGGSVGVRVSTDTGRALLEVSDSGIGISPGEQAYLFDRFFRTSEAAERAIPGTGLGLTISKALVEGHGGSIALTSVAGRGTTFRVALPLAGAGAASRPIALAS